MNQNILAALGLIAIILGVLNLTILLLFNPRINPLTLEPTLPTETNAYSNNLSITVDHNFG